MPFFSDLSFSSSSSSSDDEIEDTEEGRWRKVSALVEENNVRKEWKKLILRDDKVVHALYHAIAHDDFDDFLPRKSEILKPFSYAIPKDIKVIVLGYTPINNEKYSHGLALSSSHFVSEMAERKDLELPIYLFHQGLIKSNILENDVDYYYGHEEWAKRGVLLLNISMTATKEKGGSDDWNKHFELWQHFVKILLEKIVETKGLVTKRFVILLGTKQEELWDLIKQSSKKEKMVVLKTGSLSFSEEGLEAYSEKLKEHFLEINKIHRDIFIINKIKNENDIYVRDNGLRIKSSDVIKGDETFCVRRQYNYDRVEDVMYVKEELLKKDDDHTTQ